MLGRSVKKKNAPSQGGTVISRRAVGLMAAFFVLAAAIAVPAVVFAQDAVTTGNVDLGLEYATATGLGTTDIRTTVATVIRIFLGLLGIVAVVIILYAGILWMTAGGNEERISTAKKWLVNGIIGLILILSAFAIVQFIFGAAIGGQGGIVGTGSGGTALTSMYGRGRGTGALGAGIIEYHYPEAGAVDVPRGTEINISFKKPFVRSTVFRNYIDGFPDPTPTVSDDYVCSDGVSSETPPQDRLTCVKVDTMDDLQKAALLELNMQNVKIIPNDGLAAASSGTDDELFDQRYAELGTFLTENPRASLTPIADPIDPDEGQTISIKPRGTGLGSSTEDTNYRVAIRGGENGVLVWSVDPVDGVAFPDLAFDNLNADGSYFWSFTVGTEFDTTPPKILNIVPGENKYLNHTEGIFRNQLLQIYFDEPVSPKNANGTLPGFTQIEVTASCIPGTTVEECDWPAGGIVPGSIKLANRYRTVEFTPSTPCDEVSENSCGEKVYCLPKNTVLTATVRAATVGDEPPASIADNGVTDMSGNSFDGNRNGFGEGPKAGALTDVYAIDRYRLEIPPPADLETMSDTATLTYNVGNRLDLQPPFVETIVPKSIADATCVGDTDQCPEADTPFEDGPSKFPVDEPVVITWNKTISVGSIRTGMYDEELDLFVPDSSTVIIRAYECMKTGTEPCVQGEECKCDQLDQPAFMTSAEVNPPPEANSDADQYTVLSLIHRPFFTGNDLGYTIEEIEETNPENMPAYVPIVRAQIRDTRQNCFWPSEGFDCSELDKFHGVTSCCDREEQSAFNCRADTSVP